jgi:hypothetical protein
MMDLPNQEQPLRFGVIWLANQLLYALPEDAADFAVKKGKQIEKDRFFDIRSLCFGSPCDYLLCHHLRNRAKPDTASSTIRLDLPRSLQTPGRDI